MNKGLDALNELKQSCETHMGTMVYILQEDKFETIEKELKEYEKMKAIRGTTTFDKAIEDTLINSCPNVAKKLKTLEIIKKHPLEWLKDLTIYDTYLEYVDHCDYLNKSGYTQEEYDLLREVLL